MSASKSTIATTLAEARASLLHPSRPFTPASDERHLMHEDYPSRPNTAYRYILLYFVPVIFIGFMQLFIFFVA